MKINLIKQSEGRFIVHSEHELKKQKKIGVGEIVECNIKIVDRRSIEQNNFIWKCASLVAENTTDEYIQNAEHAMLQACIIAKHIDMEKSRMIHDKKRNITYWNFVRKSIAFENLKHEEACILFDKLIKIFADMLNISIDELKGEIGASDVINIFKGEVVK